MSGDRPPVDLSRVVVDPASVQLLAHGFCKKKGVVVLGKVDPSATHAIPVGMLDATDNELVGTLRSFLKRPVEAVPMAPADLQRALDAGYGRVGDGVGAPTVSVGGGLPLSPSDPVDALVLDLLHRATAQGATHVHLQPAAHGLSIRVRVSGALYPFASPISAEQGPPVRARLLRLSGIDEDDATLAHGEFGLDPAAGGQLPPTRVHVRRAPTDLGAEVVLRFDVPAPDRGLAELGLESNALEITRLLLEGRDGLIVVAGPGRSGRTTTLRAMVGALEREHRRVIAIGDAFAPIDGVDVRTPAQYGGDRPAAIATAVDMDADVVVLDDLTDAASFRAATLAAERGRLVVAATAAIDAVHAVAALDHAGVDRRTTAEILRGVVSPRVLPRVCPHCANVSPDAAATPCAQCGGTTVLGHTAVFEVLWLTARLADEVQRGGTVLALHAQAVADGFRTLSTAAQGKLAAGEVSPESLRAGFALRLMQ